MIDFAPYSHAVGFLPYFFSEDDPRPAKEQAHERYAHGGGWRPFDGFTVTKGSDGTFSLAYPDDPAQHEVSRARLRDELIVIFPNSWVMIVDAYDPTKHEISRMD